MASASKRKRTGGPNHTIKVEDVTPLDSDQYDTDLDELQSGQGKTPPVLRKRKGIIQTPEDTASILSGQTSRPSTQRTKTSSPLIEEKAERPAKEKKDQGASVMMQEFSQVFGELQDAILSLEYDPALALKQPCVCGSANALYRCNGSERCFHSSLRCRKCIVSDHILHPFHRIQIWQSTHFVNCSLESLGFKLRLGHQGIQCPSASKDGASRNITIVHTNGFHRLPVYFCHCIDAEAQYIQLTKARLFPATIQLPMTVFTFSVLQDFDQHVLSSKRPPYDYHNALVKMTNPATPQDVPNRYPEFNRVIRVWQHLSNVRRAGQAHSIDRHVPKRKAGCLAVRCPACPELGVNIDQSTLDNTPESEKHKVTAYISGDGNHRLQRKKKRDDPDDVALKAGQAIFVDASAFKEYRDEVEGREANKKQADKEKEPNPCAHLKATRMQNIIKFKNAVVTGVVAIQCARHGFFMPRGMADLQKGEAFANTDFVLAQVLYENKELRWIMFSYDIWCSFLINLLKRFNKNFSEKDYPGLMKAVERLRGAVPSMHVSNHIEKCQYLYSFKYTKHSGMTYGEQIETSWAEGNQTGGSTKEMNEGHRHDALDEFHNYWNWTKLHKLSASLYEHYVKCLDKLKTRIINFDKYNQQFSASLLAKWAAVDDTPRLDKNKKLISVHESHVNKGAPTLAKNYEKFVKQEKLAKLGGKDCSPLASFLQTAILIEDNQYDVRRLAAIAIRTGFEDDALLTARAKLIRQLEEWRKTQLTLFPQLAKTEGFVGVIDLDAPEMARLYLPSSFEVLDRTSLYMEEAADVERSLRHGQAYDSLETLRNTIRTFNVNFHYKKNNVHGQDNNTRAQHYLQTIRNDKRAAAERYRRAWKAMQTLGSSDTSGFKLDVDLLELTDNQLWGKDTTKTTQRGDTQSEDPWFWNVGSRGGGTDWTLDSERVKWYRDRSARDRRMEEKEILEEEMKRTAKHFEFMKAAWTAMAEECRAEDNGHGRAAYAYRQAAVYRRFEQDIIRYEKNARAKGDRFSAWLEKHRRNVNQTLDSEYSE